MLCIGMECVIFCRVGRRCLSVYCIVDGWMVWCGVVY